MNNTVRAITVALALISCVGQPNRDMSTRADSLGTYAIQEYPVPAGAGPHDVAPAPDGSVWYTAQRSGELGNLDPLTGQTHHIPLGAGSAPHGVIVGPDGAAWVTDGGLNAIVRVDPATEEVQVFPLPPERRNANLNTATFDLSGVLWFTGQNGIYGRLDPSSGAMDVFDAPQGAGPYGISTAPSGEVYYASLAHSYVGRIDLDTAEVTVLDPPTPGQGARRVWPDSQSRIWVSEWNAGQLGFYDPATGDWREWRLPGSRPQAYAVFVDDNDLVWLSDWGSNSLTLFNPTSEEFQVFVLPSSSADVRQLPAAPESSGGRSRASINWSYCERSRQSRQHHRPGTVTFLPLPGYFNNAVMICGD